MAEEGQEVPAGTWDERSLELLEYPAALELIASRCRTHAAADMARQLRPSSQGDTVRQLGAETADGRRLLHSEAVLLGGVSDCRPSVVRARQGGAMSPAELFTLAEALRGLRLTKRAIEQTRPALIALSELSRRLPLAGELEAAIRAAVDEAGVRDQASAKLAQLRAQIQRGEAEIRRRLETLIHSGETAKMLQEPLVSQRQGHWVIPVRAEFRSQLPGIVHDVSQSGATLFVEPAWAVELANRLEEVRRQEQDEVERICLALSVQVAAQHLVLTDGFAAALQLDLALARAELAEAWQAEPAEMGEDGCFVLRDARHPLLRGRVVPISVELTPEVRMVMITGPNTGGKTVALKTCGLLALLHQTGCQLPVGPGCRLPVFARVLADIGDDQSIAQSLSTFSSHMRRIILILNQVRPWSLVLLDELGAGTDPEEGAALAGSVVLELLEQQVLGLATTHYPELKAMALVTPGLVNASVTFDLATLSPTYELQIGVPGRSQAFAIASRLGLAERIVARARSRVQTDRLAMEDVIAELEAERRRQAEMRQETESRLNQARGDEQRAREFSEEARRRAVESRDQSRREAQTLLLEARRELSQALREIRRAQQEKGAVEALEEVRQRLLAWDERLADPSRPEPAPQPDRPELAVGAEVALERLGRSGRLVEVDRERQEAVVEVGALRLRLPLADLQPGSRERAAERAGWNQISLAKAQNISPELHLIGLRVDEALSLLDKYLDDAQLAGLERVRIVHGKGSGSLRRAIHEALALYPAVRHYATAEPAAGGSGVTVVEL